MKLLRRKGCVSSVRYVMNDTKDITYGIVGLVGDMLVEGILEYCDYSQDVWCFIHNPDNNLRDGFGATREDVLRYIFD